MKFDYSKVEELGFKRFELNCSVFLKQNGYDCFFMFKKLTNLPKGGRLELQWDCETHQITVNRFDKQDLILSQFVIEDEQQLEMLLVIFGV
jgi:membrane-bound inhibitor of C-type lysozyme